MLHDVSTVGFMIYCMMARRYRNRERDDCPNVQAIIEEVFARRLTDRDDLSASVWLSSIIIFLCVKWDHNPLIM